MVWANFLHIYQPPTQSKEILDKVTRESYVKVLQGLWDNPTAKATLSVPGCLTEMLARWGHGDVIERISALLQRGQLELTETAKYHAFLPKLPEEEIVRQIKLNHQTNRKYFGPAYRPMGFFPPEMAYSEKVGRVVRKLGYQWMILDEVAIPTGIKYRADVSYADGSGLHFFFRERGMSFKILSAQLGTGSGLIRELGERLDRSEYLLTAMDGETFGHHRMGLENLLTEIYKDQRLPTVFVSDLRRLFVKTVKVSPRPSTWALMDYDLAKKEPYSRWDDRGNSIHKLQWQLVKLAVETAGKESGKARASLDQALHSDQFWWASARPWWSLEMVERGAHDLVAAIKVSGATAAEKAAADKIYTEIIRTGFDWQRSGKVANLSRREDEEIKARMFADKTVVTVEEYSRMIATLESQMLAAAEAREYARAELLRKRIEELSDERDKVPHAHEAEVTVNI